MTTSVPAPAEANLAQLAAEIAAAHGWSDPASITHPYRPDGTTDGGDIAVLDDGADLAKVRSVMAAHTPDPDFGRSDEDRQLRAIRAKAVEVAGGSGTFTAAQVQKILAHIVLRATR